MISALALAGTTNCCATALEGTCRALATPSISVSRFLFMLGALTLLVGLEDRSAALSIAAW
jgi:hypothetical protein